MTFFRLWDIAGAETRMARDRLKSVRIVAFFILHFLFCLPYLFPGSGKDRIETNITGEKVVNPHRTQLIDALNETYTADFI